MGQAAPLNERQVQDEVARLKHWSLKDGKLHADLRFNTFTEAFAFMTRVAFAAEAAQHHPAWHNMYNHVTIDLITHDAGDAITQKDIELARQIDDLLG